MADVVVTVEGASTPMDWPTSTRLVTGQGTSRQRRSERRAWSRWWARYRADGSPAIVVPADVEVRLLSATVPA